MQTLRALIVEDSEDDYLLLKKALLRGGFEPDLHRVQTQPEFISAIAEKWDIILSDYSLPGFDGASVLEILRTHQKDIPVIIISGTIGEETAVAAMKLGAHDYFMKGNLTRLPGAIRRELREAQVRRDKKITESELRHTSLELMRTALSLDRESTILHSVLESAAEGILVADETERFVYFNPAAQRILGVAPWEQVGSVPPGFEIFQPDQKTKWPPENGLAMKALRGIPTDDEVAFIRSPGRAEGFWIEINARPLHGSDENQRGAVIVLRDITRRMLHEKTIADQQQLLLTTSKMSALGELASGITHEIANPLTAILGLTFHLKNKLPTNDMSPTSLYKAVETIEAMADRISKIVKGLRTFSRDADKAPIELIYLSEVIGGTIELCRERIRAFNVKFHYAEPASDLGLECRPSELSQVVLTLLSNACDSIEGTNEPWIRLEIEKTDTRVEISVTDNGAGIPEALHLKIFEPFFTTKAPNHGVGLGLSIAASIVESHHGKLFVDRKSPNTRFVVDLPLRQPRD